MAAGAAAFETFYSPTKDAVFRAVLLTVRHWQRAEDATAEAFTRALADWATVSSIANPTGWVVRTAINVERSRWRILRREQAEPPDAPAPPDEHPIDDALLRALWKLPRRQRQAVTYRLILDLSEAETARVMDIATDTVGVHLHRALATLRTDVPDPANLEAPTWTTTQSPLR